MSKRTRRENQGEAGMVPRRPRDMDVVEKTQEPGKG